ncbi:MAG: hypothetical protein QOF96_3680, partial [Actinomycetota bacterium]|nr:hypothetical protein [Actinomycetota bacterium]
MARAAAVLSLGGAVLVFGSAPAPADSPASSPAGSPADAPGGSFVAGSGDAVANVGRVVARASGLPLATTFGGALAH